jgi:hypothetical protein
LITQISGGGITCGIVTPVVACSKVSIYRR